MGARNGQRLAARRPVGIQQPEAPDEGVKGRAQVGRADG
jgi:hypothetical protein